MQKCSHLTCPTQQAEFPRVAISRSTNWDDQIVCERLCVQAHEACGLSLISLLLLQAGEVMAGSSSSEGSLSSDDERTTTEPSLVISKVQQIVERNTVSVCLPPPTLLLACHTLQPLPMLTCLSTQVQTKFKFLLGAGVGGRSSERTACVAGQRCLFPIFRAWLVW